MILGNARDDGGREAGGVFEHSSKIMFTQVGFSFLSVPILLYCEVVITKSILVVNDLEKSSSWKATQH
jgi:hypothetical protein